MTTTAVGNLQQIQARFDQLIAASTTASTSSTSTTSSADIFAKLIAAMEAQSTDTATTSSSATGSSIVSSAAKYEGVPYVFGGTSSSGMDCSGLVQTSLADVGIKVGRLVSDQAKAGTEVPSLAQAKPGDLIVLDGGEHIVIYAGNGNVIHAPDVGRNVTETKAWFTDADIVTIRRVAPEASSTTSASSTTTSSVSATDALQALMQAQAAMLAGSLK